MNKEKLYKTSVYDFMLAGVILIFSVGSLFSFRNHNNEDKKVMIYKNNALVKEVVLPVPDTEYFTIDNSDIEIEVKNDKVRVAKVSCPLEICKHTGWISSPYETIVCIPNKLLIKIVSKTKKEPVCNAVSY